MRKIKYIQQVTPTDFSLKEIWKLKLENGDLVTVFDRPSEEVIHCYLDNRFEEWEYNRIMSINKGLAVMGMVEMTLEEVKYMLNWGNLPEIENIDELQNLSGFVVEKTVKYV